MVYLINVLVIAFWESNGEHYIKLTFILFLLFSKKDLKIISKFD